MTLMIPVNSHTTYIWQLMTRDICQIYALTVTILGESERQVKHLVVFMEFVIPGLSMYI